MPEIKTLTLSGKIVDYEDHNNHNTISIGELEQPIAETLEELYGKQVTLRYWISDTLMSREELAENNMLVYSGALYANYGAAYSECTGYLWTDDKLNVGGHDLRNELEGDLGKYLYLEAEYQL